MSGYFELIHEKSIELCQIASYFFNANRTSCRPLFPRPTNAPLSKLLCRKLPLNNTAHTTTTQWLSIIISAAYSNNQKTESVVRDRLWHSIGRSCSRTATVAGCHYRTNTSRQRLAFVCGFAMRTYAQSHMDYTIV